MRVVYAILPALGAILSGCVVGPEHTAPEITLPLHYSESTRIGRGQLEDQRSWEAFGEARLNRYIETGLQQNLDVLQALERIHAAEAQVTIAGAGAMPGLQATSTHTISGTKADGSADDVPITRIADGGVNAGWVLDLFGRYKRARQSALAQLDAAIADSDTTNLALLSQVASTYVDVRFYQVRLELTRQNIVSRRQTLALTKLQLQAGAASRLDVIQAEGLVNSSLAELPELETQIHRAGNHLATLLGQPASSLSLDLQEGGRQPVPIFEVDHGVPADLLRHRPDIRAAERRLAGSVAEIGVAQSQLYPSIELGGSVFARHSSIGRLQDSRALAWSFGPQLVLPIFDGGSLQANVAAASSRSRENYLVWKSTVLAAVEEVENALVAIHRDRRTVQALKYVLSTSQEALTLATASYTDGASSLLDMLDAQRQVATARTNLAQAIPQVALDYIALNVATGSGGRPWSPATSVMSVYKL